MKHARQPGQHRAPQPGRRRAEPPGRRRAAARPRYGRIAVFCASATVTGIALLGSLDLLPEGVDGAAAATGEDLRTAGTDDRETATGLEPAADETATDQKPAQDRLATTARDRDAARQSPAGATDSQESEAADDAAEEALPADSGSGYRVVFSEGRQRVWLVDDGERVVRTYLASGSIYDNLDPGTYEVFSTSRYAVGIDDSGTMEYFVRFTHGDAGAAIGFHSIPVDDGVPVQTEAQLGTPLSHGCIRQREEDAIALWDFAPIGTTVVVTP